MRVSKHTKETNLLIEHGMASPSPSLSQCRRRPPAPLPPETAPVSLRVRTLPPWGGKHVVAGRIRGREEDNVAWGDHARPGAERTPLER